MREENVEQPLLSFLLIVSDLTWYLMTVLSLLRLICMKLMMQIAVIKLQDMSVYVISLFM